MNKKINKPELQAIKLQMNDSHRAYFQEVSKLLYKATDESTRLTEARADRALLQLARQIVRLEAQGRPVEQLLQGPPAAFAEQLADDIRMRRPRTAQEKLHYYVLIAWSAITWVFFIYMFRGYFSLWLEGTAPVYEISTTLLLLIAALAVASIELMTRFLGTDSRNNKEETPGAPSRRKLSLKSIGMYVVFVVLVSVGGLILDRMLPVFPVTPLQSLIIFAIGLAGQIALFRSSN